MRVRHGQVALYLLLALIAICILALSNADSFLAVRAKNRLQNAGDAAALAAAHEQGRLLNEIGRLNLEHINAAIQGDASRCAAIVQEQRRLAFLGPFNALREANRAAKDKNNLVPRKEFSDILTSHISDIADKYRNAPDIYPPPWEGAWDDYLQEWLSCAQESLAVGPDNIEYFDTVGGHLLFDRDFYYAIAAQNWCWFHFNAAGALRGYKNYSAWESPFENPFHEENCANSELFSLHIEPQQMALTNILSYAGIRSALRNYKGSAAFIDEITPPPLLTNDLQVWFCFDSRYWGQWFDGRRLASDPDGAEFPLDGEIKEVYNVRGCAAICRVRGDVPSTVQEDLRVHTWVAAAKPFGSLVNNEPVTAANNFILPAFNAVRLVPIDAVGGSDLATADYDWVTHQQQHLLPYLQNGPRTNEGCWYCAQLIAWEVPSFHTIGTNWLNFNASSCIRPTGGTWSGGGTSHGH